MEKNFKKLMRQQIQKDLNDYQGINNKTIPVDGWIRTIRKALDMSSSFLAYRFKCNASNIIKMEKREQQGTITLETLQQAAQALNCKLVYCLIPLEPIENLRKKQAELVADKIIDSTNHSMKLEDQGLTSQQLQQKKIDLVQELLDGNANDLWRDDAI